MKIKKKSTYSSYKAKTLSGMAVPYLKSISSANTTSNVHIKRIKKRRIKTPNVTVTSIFQYQINKYTLTATTGAYVRSRFYRPNYGQFCTFFSRGHLKKI